VHAHLTKPAGVDEINRLLAEVAGRR